MSTVLYEDENHKCIKFDVFVAGGEVLSYECLIVARSDTRWV